MIDASKDETSICLLIGDPVNQSLSPKMHNAAYAASNLNFNMRAEQIQPELLAAAMSNIRAQNISGLAVTMPHKISIMEFLDEVDPIALEIGAINTVVNNAGKLRGYNTDWLGIITPLEQRMELNGATVAVLGAGGAAQAAVYALTRAGSKVTVLNRTTDKAKLLADKFGASFKPLKHDSIFESYQVIINTTPLGMGELQDQTPLLRHQLTSDQVVFETIYAPRETLLLKAALAAGCQVIRGYEMFLEQGMAQFKLHTGIDAPKETMLKSIE